MKNQKGLRPTLLWVRRSIAVLAVAGGFLSVGVAPAAAASIDRSDQYWLDSGYGVQRAWDVTKGKGAVIAVMDTGIKKGPKEFSGVIGGTDVSGVGSSDGRTPLGDDMEKNHGSWVASLAAGRGDGTADGLLGIAPEASLLSISLGFPSSGSTVSFVDQVSEGIHWAVDNGADVINMSFTTNTKEWDPSWDEAFQYAYDNDVVVVAAAGNRGSGTDVIGAPATIPGVLVVGGVDRQGEISVRASTDGITIAVTAPSEKLTGVSADGSHVEWAGTSGASPIVAGMVALLRAKYPDMNVDNIINRLIQTANPSVNQGDEVPSPDYGYGFASIGAALTDDIEPVDANPMGSLADWVKVNRRAEADDVTPPEDTSTVKALPSRKEATASESPLLPTQQTLRYVSVPAAFILGVGSLIVLGLIGARRHWARVERER
ncbi:S8/S53 family peptidase [Microbacterium sp. MPKO10]|uniref:S8/S53 family peptidase n=1 Tax=Microbacterium sp. MPKO10 TaxID=2989818 RepID=UPI002235D54B|nr:S8/S53 family peptidase [Microbacterium sp. MPKO10]MCW4457930.1 S8/S53 family peptidase [Microbacterium sp. MPKO10]